MGRGGRESSSLEAGAGRRSGGRVDAGVWSWQMVVGTGLGCSQERTGQRVEDAWGN